MLFMKNENEIFKRVVPDYQPDDNARTKIIDCGHVKEVRTIERISNSPPPCKRISKDLYLNKMTGEVREYKHKEREKNILGFKKTFTHLRCIINTNFKSDINELHIVLNYKKDMFDFDKASNDFKSFWGKLKYRYKNLEYIKIIEPHKSGSWHVHVLLKSSEYHYLFIPINELTKMWGHGSIKIKKITENDNIGAYFSPNCDYIVFLEENLNMSTVSKKEIKGTRLKFYPSNKKFYSYSKGIQIPKIIITNYGIAKEILNFDECIYKEAYEIFKKDSVDNSVININRMLSMQFNSKRKKKS